MADGDIAKLIKNLKEVKSYVDRNKQKEYGDAVDELNKAWKRVKSITLHVWMRNEFPF